MKKVIYNVQTGEKTVEECTAEEVAAQEAYERDVLPVEQMKALRAKRNRLIAETDYLALSDSTLSAEMAAYRQALRDLPANTTDPANPVWPTKPEADS
jgi:hypothetical protein